MANVWRIARTLSSRSSLTPARLPSPVVSCAPSAAGDAFLVICTTATQYTVTDVYDPLEG